MQKAKDTPLLFDNQTIKSVADKHKKTPAQVLLRWATQRDVAVIPKSNNQTRLAQNLDVCSFDLSKQEIDEISALNKSLRFNDPLNVSTALNSIRKADANDSEVWGTATDLGLDDWQSLAIQNGKLVSLLVAL